MPKDDINALRTANTQMFCISSWSQIWRILRIINFPLDCSKLPSTTNVSKYLAKFFKRHAKYWKQCLRGHLNISSCQKHKFMVNTIEYNQLFRHQRLHQRDKISGLSSFPQSKFCRRKFVRTHQIIPPKKQTLTFSQFSSHTPAHPDPKLTSPMRMCWSPASYVRGPPLSPWW